ncbi:hypothetical protein RhiirC2_707488 [Rhizophagus irregularis]|uniref:Uncharacterized protein n=1 Tax=Rhizophagus irregularis TaxID=588596 RepID=A0A2N1NR35_9GLOM|nr:hypothetical protein RhiirC2_707488 [Rhizophagus irregularis]
MHVLNLAVNKGLNLNSESVKKVRSLMSYIKTSQTGKGSIFYMLEKWKRMEPALNLLAANNPNVRQRYLTDFDRINIDDTIVLLSPIERSTHFLSASNSLIDESASFTITHYFGKFLPLIIIFLVVLTSFFRNIIFFDIYDKDVFGDIKINSCEFFLALQGNSHVSNCCHKKFRLQLRTIG